MAENQANAIVLMPDIGGFTEFISAVEIDHGRHIISELLETLLDNRILRLELSEVEGDALLLFRRGAPPSKGELMAHVSRWFEAFHQNLKQLKTQIFCGCGACQTIPNLSLKVVGHYGHIAHHTVGGRASLFGTDVVLPHRMLKNGVNLANYVLFSDRLWKDLEGAEDDAWAFRPHQEDYPVFGQVEMALLDMGPYVEALPPPPPLPENEPLSEKFEEQVIINAPFETCVAHVGDYSKWPLWSRGMAPDDHGAHTYPRKGAPHRCVVDGRNIDMKLEIMHHTSESLVFANRLSPAPPMLKGAIVTYIVAKIEGGVAVTTRVEYEPKPLLGWIVRKFIAEPLRQRSRENLDSLKALLEPKDANGLPTELGGPAGASRMKGGEPPGDSAPRDSAPGDPADGVESAAQRHGLAGA